MAESLSWVPSKVSKIENGKQTPTDDDIRGWALAVGRENETEGLLASLNTLEIQHAEWQRVLKAGMLPHQVEIGEQDERTKVYRVFEPGAIPGLLQTPEYARSRFSQAVMLHNVPNDVDEAVERRMLRQGMLYRPDKHFHFVLTEAGLHNRLCPLEVMLGQLDRLISLTSLRNVRLGIIDKGTQCVVDPRHNFWIYNNELVRVETYSAELNLRQPQEVELYASIFESHASIAGYGAAARAIVNRVIAALSTELPEDGE